MLSKLSLKDLPIKNRKVLMRVDFNVPLDDQGAITDDTRIQASLPSIRYVLEAGGALILMSHLGRPKGEKDLKYSLKPCAERLSYYLNTPVQFAADCVGQEVKEQTDRLKSGELLLLENLRFHPEEEDPKLNPQFVKELASLGDCYVNDAFGTAHRAHASTTFLAQYFPGLAAAGFLLEKEIEFLGELVREPQRPFYAIIGGAKVSTKLGVLKSLISKVDALFLGGGMTYTFLKAQGIPIGDSICEDECLQEAREVIELCQKKGVVLYLPVDLIVADQVREKATIQTIQSSQGVPEDFSGVDIGPETVKIYTDALKWAKTILWNGPLGVFEIPQFAAGTFAIACALAKTDAVTVVGGGDSLSAINQAGVADKITHLSTGGGASLEYLEFGELPGIEALSSFPAEVGNLKEEKSM